VNGPETHPAYRYLKNATDQEQIDWNFAKYLCDSAGNAKHYSSSWYPTDIEKEVEELLSGHKFSEAEQTTAVSSADAPSGDSDGVCQLPPRKKKGEAEEGGEKKSEE